MTTSEKLTDASQRLAKLSHRAKEAEDHAAAARNQAKADVEKSANEARAAAEAHAQELQRCRGRRRPDLGVPERHARVVDQPHGAGA